jgi:gamma-glutamyltranspeptidase/glutathione hydrolase
VTKPPLHPKQSENRPVALKPLPFPFRTLIVRAAYKLLAVYVCVLLTSAGHCEPLLPSFDGQGRRILPVVAMHGMVASQEAKATDAGVDILKRGGNAVDAAVAVALALAVTLPQAGNLGGGGFMLVHLAAQHKTLVIDYREAAPADTKADVFLDENGTAVPAKSRASGLGVGVPGTVAGLALALRKYGSGKFSLAELAAPAVALARQGVIVGDGLADSLASSASWLGRWPSAKALFLHADGSPLPRGDHLVQSDLANVIETIGRDGERAFYEGPIAAKLVAAVQAAGGHMTLEDLRSYQAIEREPLRGTYRGYEVISTPPPSSGGVHIIELLNILEGLPLREQGTNSAATIHDLAEAMKLAYADRAEYLGDPAFADIPVKGLISKAYAAKLRAEIAPDQARPSASIKPLDPQPYESDQTTHFSVVDEAGNAVSNTYTLNFSYGLGLVADGTGILLNNELDDFAAKPGAPNAYGLVGGAANAPGPRKRPLSSMAPTMVFDKDGLILVTGSPGGSRIITIVLEILLNVLDFGMNIAEATEAPRIHHQGLPDELRVERGLSADTIRLLQAEGYKVTIGDAWGSAQTIARANGILIGASDPRQRDTKAGGY